MPGSYQMLLGYDPYNSVTRPGRAEGFIGDEYADDEKEHSLPAWATEWPTDAQAPCEPGTQCIDHLHNPLGMLGKWVMEKTAPHYETAKDYYIRHNCIGLPVQSFVAPCYEKRKMRMQTTVSHTYKNIQHAPSLALESFLQCMCRFCLVLFAAT
jgi:hypothetical protein